jgi:hypothetical protein
VVWIKRLAPLVLIALLWVGWVQYANWKTERENNEDLRMAQITSRVWVAAAKYRTDSKAYIAYRDSALKANGLSDSSLEKYAAGIATQVDRQLQFANLVYKGVDSLVKIQDSILKAKADSAAKAGDTITYYHYKPPQDSVRLDSIKREFIKKGAKPIPRI